MLDIIINSASVKENVRNWGVTTKPSLSNHFDVNEIRSFMLLTRNFKNTVCNLYRNNLKKNLEQIGANETKDAI